MTIFIREPARLSSTSVPPATWYRWEKLGLAPKRRRLGPNMVGWLKSEIDEWLEERANDTGRCETGFRVGERGA